MRIGSVMFVTLLLFIIVTTSLSFKFHPILTYKVSPKYKLLAQKTSKQTDLTTIIGYVQPNVLTFPENMSDEWEIDCYSRPVLIDDNKKLWELLITDKRSNFRYIKTIPSNTVNSKNVRKLVESVIEESPVKPKTIRFFRNQMYNMLSIALKDLAQSVKASRCTYNLKQTTMFDFELNTPDKMPEIILADKYAFVTFPTSAITSKQINEKDTDNCRIVPLDHLPTECKLLHGLVLYSDRADMIAVWLHGMDLVSVVGNLMQKELTLHTEINQQYLIRSISEENKQEVVLFEKGKNTANGYHFLSVQKSQDSDMVDGFWLLRQF